MTKHKFPINTKKDWCIAAIFAFLLSLVLAEPIWNLLIRPLCRLSLDDFLMQFFPDKMTYANYPGTYGTLFAAVLLLTLLLLLTECLYKKSWRTCLITLLTGIILSIACIAAFHIHCRLIVSTAADNTAFSIHVTSQNEEYTRYRDRFLDTDASEETARQIARLSCELTPLPKADQTSLNQARQNGELTSPEFDIWIIYPEQYGHTFWLSVHAAEDYIYIRQTNAQSADYTFYEDNGLFNLLQETIQTD